MSKGGRWPGEPEFFYEINDRERCMSCSKSLRISAQDARCSSHTYSYDYALTHCANQEDQRTFFQRMLG